MNTKRDTRTALVTRVQELAIVTAAIGSFVALGYAATVTSWLMPLAFAMVLAAMPTMFFVGFASEVIRGRYVLAIVAVPYALAVAYLFTIFTA